MKILKESINDNSIQKIPENLSSTTTSNYSKTKKNISEFTDENGKPTEQACQIVVNKLNDFMHYNQKSLKFVFHKDLNRYYVEVVDSQTQEVIKEIPPKELLDSYYKIQKLAGKIFDTQA